MRDLFARKAPKSLVFGCMAGVLALCLAAGCGAPTDTRVIITDTCVKDGGEPDVCDCLGRESVARLDEDSLDAVVFGALGEDIEADSVLAEMGDVGQARFRSGMAAVLRVCGAEDYVSGN